MFKNKRTTYFILIAIFAVILFLEKRQFDSNLAALESDPAHETSAALKNKKTVTDDNTDKNNLNSTAPTSINDSPEDLKKFDAWIQREAKNLEDRTANQQDKEASLKAVAQKLTPGQIEILKQKSVATTDTANERIFSTYLLSLGTESTNRALTDVATTNLSLPAQQPVHSTGEATLMQEKALRTMAIDELFSRASQDPSLRTNYSQMANQIQDPGLRKYALKRAEEFK